jgi:hypothetical protein
MTESIGTGIPAGLTHPGRALLGLCTWIETDFTAGVLRRLLESGDITLRTVDDISPGQAARLLVKSGAGWGRATYGICLKRLWLAAISDLPTIRTSPTSSVRQALRRPPEANSCSCGSTSSSPQCRHVAKVRTSVFKNWLTQWPISSARAPLRPRGFQQDDLGTICRVESQRSRKVPVCNQIL